MSWANLAVVVGSYATARSSPEPEVAFGALDIKGIGEFTDIFHG